MKLNINSIGISDKGKKRKLNEDYILVNNNEQLFLLADGMGGHNAGDVASKKSCKLFYKYFINENSQNIKDKMINSFTFMNNEIFTESKNKVELRGMGATFIASYLFDNHLYFCHVGDVRAYLFRDGLLKKLTQDHSYVAKLVQDNIISEDDINEHPFRNIVTKAVGITNKIEPDFNEIELKNRDKILLCSDGLWSLINQFDIISTLKSKEKIEQKANILINLANNAGGNDNVSLILIEVNS